MKSSIDILNQARQNQLDCNQSMMMSLYGRAAAEGVPSCFVDLHKMTKGYTLLAMSEYSPVAFFECIKKARELAERNDAYKDEYRVALGLLVNVEDLFLRDAAVNYFSEVYTTPWGSNYGKSLDDFCSYVDAHMDKIIYSDCYGFSKFMPEYDLSELKRSLKTVEAYCLNLLLMYVAHKTTRYEGKSYYANTMDFGDYALVEVKSHDNYSHNAHIRPRLHQIIKEAYYNDYVKKWQDLSAELGISTKEELKTKLSRLVDMSGATDEDEKEFFKYSKKVADDDLERRSFFNTFGKFNPFYFMVKPILKVCLGAEEVGSFDTEQPFTRKRI